MVFLFVFANQNSRPSSPFGFVGEVPTRSESTSPAPADLPPHSACPKLLGELVGALDRSFLGTTLNLQLSTFNRVSFLFPSSPHLCALCVLCGENSSSFRSSLIPRHSPLTTNSFTIRTSKTPLPQLLYHPHLQAPLGSAGNKGLITPLESALTKNSPVTPVESALTKRGGVGSFPSLQHSDIPVWFPFIPFIFILFQTLLHFFAPTKNSTLLFSCNSTLFDQNTRGWVNLMPIHRSHQFGRSLGRNHLSDSVSVNSVFSAASVLIPIPCSTFNFQLSTFDRRSRPCRDCQGFCALRLSPRFRTQYNCFFTNQGRNLPWPPPNRKFMSRSSPTSLLPTSPSPKSARAWRAR